MAETGAQAITCLQCGGALDFREGARNIRCRSCGTAYAVSGEAGVKRFFLQEKLYLNQAKAAARKFLSTSGVEESLADRLRFENAELCFLPFWRLTAYAVGWRWVEVETVMKEKEVDENGRTYEVEKRGVKTVSGEPVMKKVEYSSPACDVSAYGLRGIATAASALPLKGVNFEALARRGTVFDPTKEVEQVRREAAAQARASLKEANMTAFEASLHLSDERLSVILYPVWSLTFADGDLIYPIVIDGVNGSILKARLPAKVSVRLFAPLATLTLLVFTVMSAPFFGSIGAVFYIYYLACRERARREGLYTDDLFGVWRSGPSFSALADYFTRFIERGKVVELG